MLESCDFTLNNISSEDMGVKMVQTKGGLFEESFLSSRKIIETSIYKGKKRYFKGVDIEPLSFPITLWLEEWAERDNIRAIARWLSPPYYVPFWTNINPSKVLYVMVEGEPKIHHNGLKQGYINLTLRCKDEYYYSQPIVYNFKPRGSYRWTFFNEGDDVVYPKLKITNKRNDHPIIIRNHTDGKDFILNNVHLDEVVIIDCENELIKSNQEYNTRYLYDEHNDYWLDLEGELHRNVRSHFDLEFIGEYDIEFLVQYKYIQQGGDML